jgi:cytochrome c oxidase subunit 2
MVTKTKVIDKIAFESWLENLEATGNIPDPEGLKVLKANNCLACHSLTGEKLVGPTFLNVYNSDRTIVIKGEEKEIKVDDQYIINSIYNPDDEIVKGYNKGLMQSYQKIVTNEEINEIIEYLKTLHEE